ncbi:MAG: 2OG-Fe(II) oxygenase [Myxococcales bacterium]|nr:2OG-Fe(II) oxygenase [Myxococcales bacterium]
MSEYTHHVDRHTLILTPDRFAAADAAPGAYTPLHPALFAWDEGFVDAAFRADPTAVVREDAEQIYRFPLLTPDFCARLIAEAEHAGKWETRRDIEDHPYVDGDVKNYSPWDTTQWLDNMPGVDRTYFELVRRHVAPLVERLWDVFKLQRMKRPYILKYEPDVIRDMGPHWDVETVTLIVYLNDDYAGGGTYFRKWDYTTGRPAPGTAILFPGGLSPVHEGRPVVAGRRYLLCGAYF